MTGSSSAIFARARFESAKTAAAVTASSAGQNVRKVKVSKPATEPAKFAAKSTISQVLPTQDCESSSSSE